MAKEHFVRKEFKNFTPDDPYYEGRKYPEPTVCEMCNATYKDGRWSWEKPPKGVEANYTLCPACRRIKNKYPGGVLKLTGDYLLEKEEEIINLINNKAEEEMTYRPLNRIISIKKEDGAIVIETTSPSLARLLGEAVYRAHKGELDIRYKEGEKFVEIFWSRILEDKEGEED
ncbi:MAG: BCAM0308 family protein [Thermosulfidibacteraceae bacterium]|jgi:NMD protein affecting ribosome stability and mRNA decay